MPFIKADNKSNIKSKFQLPKIDLLKVPSKKERENLNKNELHELSKNSLIRQIIKKEEVKKYFLLEKYTELSEKLLKKNYFIWHGNKKEFGYNRIIY